jgi:hypothetical protein
MINYTAAQENHPEAGRIFNGKLVFYMGKNARNPAIGIEPRQLRNLGTTFASRQDRRKKADFATLHKQRFHQIHA